MNAPALRPRIGLGGALLLSFNGAVGAAVFALPATLATSVGGWAPLLFPLTGLIVLLIAIPFARAAASMPGHGGPAIYGLPFGRMAGFQLGWLFFVARTAALAANVHVLVDYLLRWLALDLPPAGRGAVILAVIVLLALANVAGTSRALRLLGGLTLLKTLPLLGLAAFALWLAPLAPLGPAPALSAVEASLLLCFYAFVGFENAAATAGETRSADRAVPVAMLLTIGAVVLLYLLVQLAFVAVAPAVAPGEKAPLLALGTALLGPIGAALVLLAAVTSLLGNLLGNLAATPRVTFALASRGDLPRWLAAIHPRFETPAASIVAMSGIAALLALSGGFVWLAVISVLARLVVYAVTIAAWLKTGERSRGALLQGLVAILLCALVAVQATQAAWITLSLLALVGAILFRFGVRKPEH